MQTKLTVTIDEEVLLKATEYSRRQEVSLSQLIFAAYRRRPAGDNRWGGAVVFGRMARAVSASGSGRRTLRAIGAKKLVIVPRSFHATWMAAFRRHRGPAFTNSARNHHFVVDSCFWVPIT